MISLIYMNKEQIQKLREKGLTLEAIGEKAGVSKQRIHQILYPEKYAENRRIWEAKYRQTEKYKKYQREYQLKRRQNYEKNI